MGLRACVSVESLLYFTNFCPRYDSRSGGHVLSRFLPVRFESCLNDAPRLRNVLSVFQGRGREREEDGERERDRAREKE